MSSIQKTAAYGLLVALAFIFSYIESLIPVVFFVPGMKLGLANLAIFCALYLLGFRAALTVSVIRIVLVAFTFSNTFSMLYSLAGGLLSLCMMGGLKFTKKFSPIGISIAGGTAHNIGQIAVAAFVVENLAVLSYLPVLLISGCITGFLIGVLGWNVVKRVSPYVKTGNGKRDL